MWPIQWHRFKNKNPSSLSSLSFNLMDFYYLFWMILISSVHYQTICYLWRILFFCKGVQNMSKKLILLGNIDAAKNSGKHGWNLRFWYRSRLWKYKSRCQVYHRRPVSWSEKAVEYLLWWNEWCTWRFYQWTPRSILRY